MLDLILKDDKILRRYLFLEENILVTKYFNDYFSRNVDDGLLFYLIDKKVNSRLYKIGNKRGFRSKRTFLMRRESKYPNESVKVDVDVKCTK